MSVKQAMGECDACGYGPIWVVEIDRDAFDPRIHNPDERTARVCKLCLKTGVCRLESFYSATASIRENEAVKRQINYVANAIMAQIGSMQQARDSDRATAPAVCLNPVCGHPRGAHELNGPCLVKTDGPGGICQCEQYEPSQS